MKNATLTPSQIRSTFEQAFTASSPITLSGFRTPLSVENKLAVGFDPVTEADKNAEIAIRNVIETSFPDHAIIGEEWDDKETQSEYCWIIDPIDGTRAFISGVPVWGTLLGLLHNGKAVAGGMHQPFTGETWIAIDGVGTYTRNEISEPLKTSSVTTLYQARTSTTSPDMFKGVDNDVWKSISSQVLQTRYGLDCYAYCLIASGHIDLVIESGLKNVDIAPLIAVIEAAGGVITTWDGKPAALGGTCIAAATPQLHAAALAEIQLILERA